jgi:hypothetical protein
MRFYQILNEATLTPAVLKSIDSKSKQLRYVILINKIKAGGEFLTKDGQKIKIDQSILPELEEHAKTGFTKFPSTFQLPLIGGGSITSGKLEKTVDFGGQSGGDKFNRGELAEGWHALAAFVRLIKRPSEDITYQDLIQFLPRIQNEKAFTITAKETENPKIADEFSLFIALKPGTWAAFTKPELAQKDKVMSKLINTIIADANKDTARYADDYASNNKVDSIEIVGDGVSGETTTKSDIIFKNKGEVVKVRPYSIKAGSVKQIHQVGGGGIDSKNAAYATPEERYRILADDVFGVNGRASLADISGAKEAIIKAASTDDFDGRVKAQNIAYGEATRSLSRKLSTDAGDRKFLKTLVVGLKYMLQRDEPEVILKQFDVKGTHILDGRKLDGLFEQGFDLDVKKGSQAGGLPYIDIFDAKTKANLLRIRTYNSKGYLRNYFEKGPLFVQLTQIRGDH